MVVDFLKKKHSAQKATDEKKTPQPQEVSMTWLIEIKGDQQIRK